MSKKHILDYIYNTIDLSQYKYRLLEMENDLSLLDLKHFVSANFSGTNCLLVFTSFNNHGHQNNMSVLVERKTLSYDRNKVNPDNVVINNVNLKLDDSIYNGTIMDGILHINKRNGKKKFVITDVYYFRGQSLLKDSMNHKIFNISSYIKTNLKYSDIDISVNVLYELIEILKLQNDMKKIKDINFKGFVFYPEKSGTRLIFQDNKIPENNNGNNFTANIVKQNINNNSNKNNQNIQNNQNNQNKTLNFDRNNSDSISYIADKKQNIVYVAKDDKPIYATLEIRKTEQPDVYFVLCGEKDMMDGKQIIKIKKLGIAFIPDKETSNKCNKIISNKLNGRALFKCVFDNSKNKWIPLEESTIKKIPDMLDDIEKNLDIVADCD
jgi:hypothetical protein